MVLAHGGGRPMADKIIPCELLTLSDAGERAQVFLNLVGPRQGPSDRGLERRLGDFEQAHPDYSGEVRRALASLRAARVVAEAAAY
jgi:hypothetical protein